MNLKYNYITVILVLFLISQFFMSCATKIPRLGTVTYNPVKEWDASKLLYVQPYHQDDSEEYPIELKLSNIVTLLGKYANLEFVEDIAFADFIIYVSISVDTVKYTNPGYVSGRSSSFLQYNKLLKGFINTSSGSSIVIPPRDKVMYYGNVYLRTIDAHKDVWENDKTVFVSHASKDLYWRDPLLTFYNLVKECLLVIPGVDQKELNRVPALGINVFTNALNGVKVIPFISGNFTSPVVFPYVKDDVVFKINDYRIYDFLDYMTALLSLNENEKSCRVSFNRKGKIRQETVRVRR